MISPKVQAITSYILINIMIVTKSISPFYAENLSAYLYCLLTWNEKSSPDSNVHKHFPVAQMSPRVIRTLESENDV
jgi:hypothetical protein